jgi:hypothetical protein
MAFTDFPNGLQSASDYLNTPQSVSAQLSGSVADIAGFTVSAEFDINLKEIICSLLAGRGLKLPNIQICISLNLKALLPGLFAAIQGIQDALYAALESLDAAFDKFLDHLKFDEVLGRINGVLAEITQIASMINFCSAPLDPIQIPNVLENAMDSFLGAGRDIVDSIGTMLPDKIGGCLSIGGGFNTGVFNGGILGKISDNYNDIINGNLPDAFYDSIIADINNIVNQINDIIAKENGTSGVYDQGGSELAESPRETNTGMGVLFNAQDEGIQGASRNGQGLWSAYQSLAGYPVTDSDGNVYSNIFELFCDDDLLRILQRPPNPTPEIATQLPVYNYCGETIGYTKVVTQPKQDISVGTVPGVIDQPGWNAGGLSTNPITEAQTQVAAAGGGTVNTTVTNVYNIDGAGFTGTTNTTDATASEVLFDGVRQTPESNSLWFVTITAVAKRTDAAGATAIKIEGLVDNTTGTVTIAGTTGNKTVFNSTSATSNYNLLLDIVSNQLRVRIQGDTGHTVDWAVKYDFIASP